MDEDGSKAAMGRKSRDESGANDKPPSKWGYGQTDPDTWWEKGCASPNPTGRGKGRRNQKTLYREAFGVKIDVKVDGKPAKLTKDEASYTQFANRCASGEAKAMALKLQYDGRFEDPEPPKPSPEQTQFNVRTLDHYIELRTRFLPAQKKQEGGDE